MKLYHLYGLAVASDFDCPELTELTPEQVAARGLATVELRRATEPLTLDDGHTLAPWLCVTRDACLCEFTDIAQFLIERPDRITVRMLPEGVESDMRAYLFGTGFGVLMHMRGLVPLHVSAIKTPDGVVAFTGDSGAGKSTKVAELHFKHGWPVICDDVAVLHPDDPLPILHAGMNRIKLWNDAVERFGVDPGRLTRDIMRFDKFHLNDPEMFVKEPQVLETLIEIADHGTPQSQPVGADAFTLLMNAVYRPEFAAIFADRGNIFKTISRCAVHINAKSEKGA